MEQIDDPELSAILYVLSRKADVKGAATASVNSTDTDTDTATATETDL